MRAKIANFTLALALVAPTAAFAQATSAADYVRMAGAGDQYEIQSSKLVLTSTKDPKIRMFANMMVKDHTKSTANVKKAAMTDKVHAGPPVLDADGRQMMSQLKSASGVSRDQVYIDQQATAHQKALTLHQDFARGGSTPSLKASAAKIVPVVQAHIGELKNLKPAM